MRRICGAVSSRLHQSNRLLLYFEFFFHSFEFGFIELGWRMVEFGRVCVDDSFNAAFRILILSHHYLRFFFTYSVAIAYKHRLLLQAFPVTYTRFVCSM